MTKREIRRGTEVALGGWKDFAKVRPPHWRKVEVLTKRGLPKVARWSDHTDRWTFVQPPWNGNYLDYPYWREIR